MAMMMMTTGVITRGALGLGRRGMVQSASSSPLGSTLRANLLVQQPALRRSFSTEADHHHQGQTTKGAGQEAKEAKVGKVDPELQELFKASKRWNGINKLLEEKGHPSYRIKQVLQQVFDEKATNYNDISVISKDLRSSISDLFPVHGEGASSGRVLSLNVASLSESEQATKALFELHDKEKIEAVSMNFEGGLRSLCISSQAGCALACNFCATGAVGFKRQLSADEITDQVLFFQQLGQNIDSISFMGMGEPFMNPEVFKALDILTNKYGFKFSQRRLSISTVGIIPAIKRMTRDYPNVNLAFSLHSPFPEQRSVLVPANKNYPLADVLKTLDEHVVATNRKIFIAYLVLVGYNDSDAHADEIIKIFKERPASHRHLFHLNLLRYNPAFGLTDANYIKTSENKLRGFMNRLLDGGIQHITARRSFGVDIDAACGQLYASYESKKIKIPKLQKSA